MMDGNDWMKDLRSKAEHYQEPEPDGLWQDILVSVRRRHYALWRRSLVAVSSLAAMAAAVLAFIHFLSHPYSPADLSPGGALATAADVLPLSEAKERGDAEEHPGIPFVPDAVHAIGKVHIQRQSGQSDAADTDLSEKASAESMESSPADYSSPDPLSDQLPSDPSPTADKSSTADKSRQTEHQGHEGIPPYGWPGNIREDSMHRYADAGKSVSSGSRHGGISAKVYYSNLPGSSSGGSGFGSLVSPAAALDMDQAMSVVNSGDVNGSALMAVDDQLSTEVRHRQPVRAGVSVRFALPGRWGIETGLTYSLLESESDAGTSYRYFHTRRRLHYLGIPVKVTFDAVRRRHWSLYLSAGGMLEKNIAGKADKDFMVDGASVSTVKDDIMVKQLQWSLNAAAGAEYRIIPAMGLYAEPGVSWFIDNGSPIETVYQSRPVNFNLEMGLRFHF